MTFYISPSELVGLNEQELRALYGRLISDLRRTGQSAQDCPALSASLRNVQEAIVGLQQPKPQPPKAPKGPRF